MNNYRLTIQYDGGRYKGWQRLGNTDHTIQGKIEEILSRLTGEDVELIGSGRTDAGVHAIGQIANFKTSQQLSETQIYDYLNRYLPMDISIVTVQSVTERFHSRYHVKEKTYLYKIWNREYSNPFMRHYSMQVVKPLDIKKMRTASRYLIGEYDFTTFSNAKSKKKSKVRTIFAITMEEKNGMITIRIRGNGFLYHMVRKIVGILVEVGLGEKEPDIIPAMIQSKDRSKLTYLADACGLYLETIEFENE